MEWLKIFSCGLVSGNCHLSSLEGGHWEFFNQLHWSLHYRISLIASVLPINSFGVWFWPKQIIGIQRGTFFFSHCSSNQEPVHTALINGKWSKSHTQKGLLSSGWDYCFMSFPPFRNVFLPPSYSLTYTSNMVNIVSFALMGAYVFYICWIQRLLREF